MDKFNYDRLIQYANAAAQDLNDIDARYFAEVMLEFSKCILTLGKAMSLAYSGRDYYRYQ
jgi:hypothetical protein